MAPKVHHHQPAVEHHVQKLVVMEAYDQLVGIQDEDAAEVQPNAEGQDNQDTDQNNVEGVQVEETFVQQDQDHQDFLFLACQILNPKP